MRWRDVRFDKPTAADGRVLIKLKDGTEGFWHYNNSCEIVAWMPTSELPAFERIPDPPDGWRFVDKEKDARHDQAKFWDEETKHWGLVNPHLSHWLSAHTYIVPINPPEPQYRPFANAAEFEPHRDKWIKHKLDEYAAKITTYNDQNVWLGCASIGTGYAGMFKDFTFADGTPFGVRIDQ